MYGYYICDHIASWLYNNSSQEKGTGKRVEGEEEEEVGERVAAEGDWVLPCQLDVEDVEGGMGICIYLLNEQDSLQRLTLTLTSIHKVTDTQPYPPLSRFAHSVLSLSSFLTDPTALHPQGYQALP